MAAQSTRWQEGRAIAFDLHRNNCCVVIGFVKQVSVLLAFPRSQFGLFADRRRHEVCNARQFTGNFYNVQEPA